MTRDSTDHLDRLRRSLLAAALPEAAFNGWTPTVLARAEDEAELAEGTAALACPAGVVDLLDFWGRECDGEVAREVAAHDLGVMKIRERVTLGVRARIEAIGDQHREAARRAASRLVLPDAAARGGRILWRASDTIWRAIGDTSTDGNFYSKRAILSGVLGNTLAAWLNADGPGDDAPWRVLDRRIENVMQFEKLKGRVRKLTANLPSPLTLAAALRYPRRS